MPRLMLVALLALSGCAVRYVTGTGGKDVPVTHAGPVNTPLVITIEGSSSLCGTPQDSDPQHTCPAQSGPDQR